MPSVIYLKREPSSHFYLCLIANFSLAYGQNVYGITSNINLIFIKKKISNAKYLKFIWKIINI